MNGRERRDKSPEPIEIGLLGSLVLSPVGVVCGMQPREVDGDKILVVAEMGRKLQALLKLGEQKILVDPERAKAAAVLELQIIDHELGEAWMIGHANSRQQITPLLA